MHEGLAALLAWRATRRAPATVTQCATDWGLELMTRKELPVADDDWAALLSPDDLLEDLLACLDGAGLAKRQFREIARVAGLVHPGLPHARRAPANSRPRPGSSTRSCANATPTTCCSSRRGAR